MKIKPDNDNGKRRKKQALLDTPAVITLPDGTKTDSETLVQAATDPATALQTETAAESKPEPDISGMPSTAEPTEADVLKALEDDPKVIEAEFTEVPQSDAEKAAEQLLAEMDGAATDTEKPTVEASEAADAEHPADVLFKKHDEEVCNAPACWLYSLLSKGGNKLFNFFTDLPHNAKQTALLLTGIAAMIGAWLESLGARFLVATWDFIKMAGNKAWLLHDTIKKDPTVVYRTITGWQNKSFDFVKGLFKDKTHDAIKELTQVILDLKDAHQKELRVATKRIEALEKRVGANNRAVNSLVEKTMSTDPEQLTQLLKAVSQGRKTEATNLIRSVAGVSLASAKGMVEGLAITVN